MLHFQNLRGWKKYVKIIYKQKIKMVEKQRKWGYIRVTNPHCDILAGGVPLFSLEIYE